MHAGGRLIKEFDAFLHLFRSAAAAMGHSLHLFPEDQVALNRVLAGLGGPPAAPRVTIDLYGRDALPLLCLFLIMGKDRCPVGLLTREPVGALKQLVHIVAHAMVPMAAGGGPLPVDEVSNVLSDDEIALQPLVTYNEDGEVAAVLRTGGRNSIRVGAGGGPYKVAILAAAPEPAVQGAAAVPDEVALDPAGPLHPVVVRATRTDYPFPFIASWSG